MLTAPQRLSILVIAFSALLLTGCSSSPYLTSEGWSETVILTPEEAKDDPTLASITKDMMEETETGTLFSHQEEIFNEIESRIGNDEYMRREYQGGQQERVVSADRMCFKGVVTQNRWKCKPKNRGWLSTYDASRSVWENLTPEGILERKEATAAGNPAITEVGLQTQEDRVRVVYTVKDPDTQDTYLTTVLYDVSDSTKKRIVWNDDWEGAEDFTIDWSSGKPETWITVEEVDKATS